MRWTSSSADICSFFFEFEPSVYSVSSTRTACRLPSASRSCSASLAVVTPVKVMPSGLSSVRAAALRPLTNSRSSSCSSLMTRMRLTGFAIRPAQYNGTPWTTTCVLLHPFERVREPALVTIAGVAMKDAFRHDAVDHALRFAQRFRGVVLVARRHCLFHVLDRRANLGAQAHVVRATLDGLPCALLCGFDIGHKRAGILT